jgi:hypothetical protein
MDPEQAFNAGGSVQSKSLKPVKDSVVSMLELKDGLEENENKNMEKTENVSQAQESNEQQSPASDKYPAPSTPQLKQGERLLDDGDCQDHINCLIEKESVEQEGDSKSVETTCAMSEETLQAGDPQSFTETVIKEEDDSTDGVKSENNMCPNSQNKDTLNHSNGCAEKASSLHNSHGTRANRKKMKVTDYSVYQILLMFLILWCNHIITLFSPSNRLTFMKCLLHLYATSKCSKVYSLSLSLSLSLYLCICSFTHFPPVNTFNNLLIFICLFLTCIRSDVASIRFSHVWISLFTKGVCFS